VPNSTAHKHNPNKLIKLPLRLLCSCASFTCFSTSPMANARFLFSTSRPIIQPYDDEDCLQTPYSVAVAVRDKVINLSAPPALTFPLSHVFLTHYLKPTPADHVTSSDTLVPTPILARHTFVAPPKGASTQLDAESMQNSGYPPQEMFLHPGPSARQLLRRFLTVRIPFPLFSHCPPRRSI